MRISSLSQRAPSLSAPCSCSVPASSLKERGPRDNKLSDRRLTVNEQAERTCRAFIAQLYPAIAQSLSLNLSLAAIAFAAVTLLHPRSLSSYRSVSLARTLRLLEEVSGHETVSEHVSLRFSAAALFGGSSPARSCSASSASSFNREFSPLQRRCFLLLRCFCFCCGCLFWHWGNYVKRLAYFKNLDHSFGVLFSLCVLAAFSFVLYWYL